MNEMNKWTSRTEKQKHIEMVVGTYKLANQREKKSCCNGFELQAVGGGNDIDFSTVWLNAFGFFFSFCF